MKRATITSNEIKDAIDRFKFELAWRVIQKGKGTLASSHEILGVIQEEMRELEDAIREGKEDRVAAELLDIAVGAVFGVACIDSHKVDW